MHDKYLLVGTEGACRPSKDFGRQPQVQVKGEPMRFLPESRDMTPFGWQEPVSQVLRRAGLFYQTARNP